MYRANKFASKRLFVRQQESKLFIAGDWIRCESNGRKSVVLYVKNNVEKKK